MTTPVHQDQQARAWEAVYDLCRKFDPAFFDDETRSGKQLVVDFIQDLYTKSRIRHTQFCRDNEKVWEQVRNDTGEVSTTESIANLSRRAIEPLSDPFDLPSGHDGLDSDPSLQAIPGLLTPEQAEVLGQFHEMLRVVTADGGRKRAAGTKVSWKIDTGHTAAIFSHLAKWLRGDKKDEDSGISPLVHLAWRALSLAAQEMGIK